MTAKEIQTALKSGQKVILNRAIIGARTYERLNVTGAKTKEGLLFVRFMFWNNRRLSFQPTWVPILPGSDDYVSIDFPPAEPVKFEPSPAVGAPGFCKILIPEVK